MHRLKWLGLAALGLAAVALAEDNTPPEGFTALFNGKDLTGWKGLFGNPKTRAAMKPEALAHGEKDATEEALEHWKVEDGIIVYDGKASHLKTLVIDGRGTHLRGEGSHLCTTKDYANFELYLDWKIGKGGDSGIYLRGTPQVQIWDAKEGSGALWNNKKHGKKPLVVADNPVGEWNTFYIKMVGDKVTVKLNDKLVVDNVALDSYWERDKPIYPTGQIELQSHGSPLWFKNIYIKELPATEEKK